MASGQEQLVTPWRRLQAGLILIVGLWLLIMMPPGFDTLSSGAWSRSGTIGVRHQERWGWYAKLLQALQQANNAREREIRKYRLDTPERLFRIGMQWKLFPSGPRGRRWLRVVVDGAVIYESNDDRRSWNASQLGNRRLRAPLEQFVRKHAARNWRGFATFVVRRVRADHPQARTVRLEALWEDIATGSIYVHHAALAVGPAWHLTLHYDD